MRLVLLAVLLLTACAKRHPDKSLGAAEAEAALIFGTRAYCTGDHTGWTCFAVDTVNNGQVTYRPQPIVVCKQNEACRRVDPPGTAQCATMGVPR